MEEKCEDLRKQVDDLNHQVENERRKTERILQEQRTKTKDDSSKISPMVCLPATTATTPAVTLQNNGNNKDQTMVRKWNNLRCAHFHIWSVGGIMTFIYFYFAFVQFRFKIW